MKFDVQKTVVNAKARAIKATWTVEIQDGPNYIYAPYIPKSWEKIGIDQPTGKWVYNTKFHEVKEWIESQPIHMWKHYDVPLDRDMSINALMGHNYLFTEEMEAWFFLRWS